MQRCCLAWVALLLLGGAAEGRELRVCADPSNLPFSSERLDGFENEIIAVVARALNAVPTYTWWAQRRGFVYDALDTGRCDVVPGARSTMEMLRTTAPYYRSTYVLVTRQDGPQIRSLDDPALRHLTMGVQLIGDDGANKPPAHALARRGLYNVRGYPVYGDYRGESPPARIVASVAQGELDVAFVWGPVAGYFARQQPVRLRLTPVEASPGEQPMAFDIAMGVRKDDVALHDAIDAALARHRDEIGAILRAYAVPLAEPGR